ncbi:hypothetical protein F511_20414 [Dorcoceras hygrometricum]|uniref:Uncharacterized protein n=1 Tax=Dorcoceras hygrometricum TaxID=472368 RepID=A0A2Z7BRE7_9LAMI|nr:hypothetical protein F511_20414 [Dorcoceras hygrometricum]
MFLVDWAVKTRIRPPEFETSICDAKYHVSLPPLLSSPSAAAAARCRRKFVSGQLDEENPFVLISSALLVQPDEGVSVLVVDRIGDNLPQSTEKSRVLVIPVGARHKFQQDRKTKIGKRPSAHRRVRRRPINHAHMSARFIVRAVHLVAADARWWPHRWTLQAQVVAPLFETCAPLAPLLHVAAGRCRARWSRVLRDGWPLDVAQDGRGWAALSEMARIQYRGYIFP